MENENNILIIKLASGEELVASCVMDELSIYVEDAVHIMNVPDGQGGMATALVPWAPYAKSFAISRIGTHIGIPQDRLVDKYKEMTTGIVLPDSSIQIAK